VVRTKAASVSLLALEVVSQSKRTSSPGGYAHGVRAAQW